MCGRHRRSEQQRMDVLSIIYHRLLPDGVIRADRKSLAEAKSSSGDIQDLNQIPNGPLAPVVRESKFPR